MNNNISLEKLYLGLLLAATLVFGVVYTNHLKNQRDLLATDLAEMTSSAAESEAQLDTFKELAEVYPNNRAIVLAIAITESNGNYKVKHPDKHTVGIGGIKPSIWRTENPTNSLLAIEEIVEELRDRGYSDYEVIKHYKGAKTNLKSTEQCYDLYCRLSHLF